MSFDCMSNMARSEWIIEWKRIEVIESMDSGCCLFNHSVHRSMFVAYSTSVRCNSNRKLTAFIDRDFPHRRSWWSTVEALTGGSGDWNLAVFRWAMRVHHLCIIHLDYVYVRCLWNPRHRQSIHITTPVKFSQSEEWISWRWRNSWTSLWCCCYLRLWLCARALLLLRNLAIGSYAVSFELAFLYKCQFRDFVVFNNERSSNLRNGNLRHANYQFRNEFLDQVYYPVWVLFHLWIGCPHRISSPDAYYICLEALGSTLVSFPSKRTYVCNVWALLEFLLEFFSRCSNSISAESSRFRS